MTTLEMLTLTTAPFTLIFLVAVFAFPPRSTLGYKLGMFGMSGMCLNVVGWAVYAAVWVSRHLCY